MRSERQTGAVGYLGGILAQGARPFAYRSGLRSLLGMPEKTAWRSASSAILPAVGFRYLQQPFLTWPPGFDRETSGVAPPVPVHDVRQQADPVQSIPAAASTAEPFPESPARSGENSSLLPRLADSRPSTPANPVAPARKATRRAEPQENRLIEIPKQGQPGLADKENGTDGGTGISRERSPASQAQTGDDGYRADVKYLASVLALGRGPEKPVLNRAGASSVNLLASAPASLPPAGKWSERFQEENGHAPSRGSPSQVTSEAAVHLSPIPPYFPASREETERIPGSKPLGFVAGAVATAERPPTAPSRKSVMAADGAAPIPPPNREPTTFASGSATHSITRARDRNGACDVNPVNRPIGWSDLATEHHGTALLGSTSMMGARSAAGRKEPAPQPVGPFSKTELRIPGRTPRSQPPPTKRSSSLPAHSPSMRADRTEPRLIPRVREAIPGLAADHPARGSRQDRDELGADRDAVRWKSAETRFEPALSGSEAGATIARLRRQVQELTARKAAPPTAAPATTQPVRKEAAVPPRPRQTPVPRRPARSPATAPRAFWERSYLNHYALRILR